MLLTIQTIQEKYKNDKGHFLLAGYSKDFETWGFLLRIDAKLSVAPLLHLYYIHGSSVAESIFTI